MGLSVSEGSRSPPVGVGWPALCDIWGPRSLGPEPWQRVSVLHDRPSGKCGPVQALPGGAVPPLGRRAHRGAGEGVTWAQLCAGDVKC